MARMASGKTRPNRRPSAESGRSTAPVHVPRKATTSSPAISRIRRVSPGLSVEENRRVSGLAGSNYPLVPEANGWLHARV
jgi:hypothetical protein